MELPIVATESARLNLIVQVIIARRLTLDTGLAQVTRGLAWWYRNCAMEQTPEGRGRYESVQTEAKSKRMGLWNDRNPVPPWEWRDH
ncbi:MAG: thermonuclease family protein [Candidatus Methylophosphatis roskildensis]